MTLKEFLLKPDSPINRAEVAKQMWPKNKSARTYLEKKLNGARPWTENDTALCMAVLKKLAVDIQGLEV